MQGDDSAFGQLFDRHRDDLKRVVGLRIGGQLAARLDASDVVQESFLDACTKADRYRHSRQVPFYIWLRGITHDRLRKLQRMHLGAKRRAAGRELQLPERSSTSLAIQLISPASSPSTALRARELRRCVVRAIESLDEIDREVILMRHFERLSNAQVAQVMGIPASTATMRHGRALVKLKALLAGQISQGDLA
jgi:RNA polymerase sigma-70 factor (ECF subfamily)